MDTEKTGLEDEINTAPSFDESLTEPGKLLDVTVWRKIDMCLLPIVTTLFLLSFLDRTNIGNARVAGLLVDLDMSPRQYSIALTVTYVPYILTELPSNLLLKRIGPNVMLPTMLTLWGVVATCQGLVKSYHGLLACRFLLGLFEGGLLPGLVLYTSLFYPKNRLQIRVATFISCTSISGAFSGIMAYGIIRLHGQGGHAGWQWIFIIEGSISVFIGLISFFLIPRSPGHARFLNSKEKAYIQAVLRQDSEAEDETHFEWSQVGRTFLSPHILLVGLTAFCVGVVLFSQAYFTPTIVLALGYTAAKAQLMSVPPFSFAVVLAMIAAYIADRYRCRGIVSLVGSIFCIAGFALFLKSRSHHIQYASLFLSNAGVSILGPALSTWTANNTAPYVRRASGIAIWCLTTNSGGILATWLMGSLSPAPDFTLATKVLLSLSVLMAVFVIANVVWLTRTNGEKAERRRTVPRGEEAPGLGDTSAWFVYSL
ncbi:unnamed protein product [Mycena citricolor]|uniref:Major facilitator superfamily (MFS) profile domain-containing protein n=1 Tax=Mycena citricolor TaxID=2018698 RepID=A0AAD2HQE4_9AGAR|nr:unnamed protein product [Mycena citricolor]